MGHGKVVNPPFTVDAQGVPVGFTGGRYGQDIGVQLAIAQQHTPVTCPADTNENVLFAYTVPGGLMGPNDTIRISFYMSCTNSANTKNVRLRFAGFTLRLTQLTTSSMFSSQTRISGRNSQQQQIATILVDSITANSVITRSEDMTTPTQVTITGQLTNSTESLVLETAMVELIRGA